MTLKFCPKCHKVFYWIAGTFLETWHCPNCRDGRNFHARDKFEYHLNHEGLGWSGGASALELSYIINRSESATRKRLKELQTQGKVYYCAPPIDNRADNKTAQTYLWFLEPEK